MSNKENLLLRIKAVQALDQLYYQKGEHLYSHRRVWRNHARRIFGINYTTYASYLRRDVSHLPDQPEVAETVRTDAERLADMRSLLLRDAGLLLLVLHAWSAARKPE